MDVRIGVVDNPREITLTLPEGVDHSATKAAIAAALGGSSHTLWLIDDKGREVAVPANRIVYVEIAPTGSNAIGFG